MNPERFFIPNMNIAPMMRMNSNLGMNPLVRANSITPRIGLFSKLTNSIKGFNWSGLLSGANKTLNVVNQTIPLIRQTKPMINNVKNMMSIAKAFRKETVSSRNIKKTNIINSQIRNTEKNNINNQNTNVEIKKETIDNNNYPNFFI